MKRIILSFFVVVSSIVLFSSCCNSCEESNTTDTWNNTPVVTSTVERVRILNRDGYSRIWFMLENGVIGNTSSYYSGDSDLCMVEVGDEVSYRLNGKEEDFYDSEGNDYEVIRISFKKQDKDNSDSYWN